MFAIKACKAWKTKAQDVSSMTLNNTNPSDLSTLDDQSLEVLIQHYLKLKHRMPDNLTVRERLLELEREQFDREREQQQKDKE
jgi:hypothetical protein